MPVATMKLAGKACPWRFWCSGPGAIIHLAAYPFEGIKVRDAKQALFS